MRESQIEAALVAAVAAAGGKAYKLLALGNRGLPDRLVVMPGGRISFVEVKAPGKRPTIGQQREHERLRALGCRVDVIDSLEGVGEWLRSSGW